MKYPSPTNAGEGLKRGAAEHGGGVGNETRTRTVLLPSDFKSEMSTIPSCRHIGADKETRTPTADATGT